MSTIEERIQTLETRLSLLKTRQGRIDARKRQLASRRARQLDTRRKILAGGIVLARLDAGELDPGLFRSWLDAALTRPEDRTLFDI